MAKSRKKEPTWYSVAVSAKVAGLSVHMINYLYRNKIVIPSGPGKAGRGNRRQYSFTDVVLLRAIAKLLDQGISVLRFAKQFKLLESRKLSVRDLLVRKYLVTDGADVFLQDKGVLERLDSGQTAFTFVLDLKPIRDDVSELLLRKSRSA